MKKIFTLILFSIIAFNAIHAEITWTLSDNGTLTISGTSMPNYDIRYAPYAPWFSQRDKIKKVVIEKGVTNIGSFAFHDCSVLTSVTIPNSVTSIEQYAFNGCSALTSVTIPNSVTYIGGYTFYGCSGLTSLTIPNSVTNIGAYAFYGCSGLTSLTASSMKLDSKGSFYGCESITSVTIPNSVTSIGYQAFYNCSGLTSITIPSSVTSIGEKAFSGCTGLTSVTIPNSVTSIGHQAFFNCSGLIGSLAIPNSVTNIWQETFYGCSGITSITIPNSVTSIGSSAFSGCSGITSITIPNSVTSIGSSVFSGCSALASITIPSTMTGIGSNAFAGTAWYNNQPDGLIYVGLVLYKYKGTMPVKTSIIVKDGTKGIAGNAFYDCYGLTSITIPNSVTSIGEYVFQNCKNLTSATIDMKNIGSNIFYGCSSLTSLTISNNVVNIEGSAFKHCKALKNVTIGNSVENIGENAFYNCYNLQSITITNPNPPSCVSKETFTCSTSYVRDIYDIYNYTTLHIPMGSKEAYSSAQEWRYFNKIKEDMEIDGKVYYAKLSVKQGTSGYTELPVKADETYTIYIGALGNSKINAVTFNGEDVTDQVKDGYYTTPAIKAKSTLSISYEESNITNVKEISNPELKVTGNEGEINISGIDNPTNVEVYTTDGRLVETRGSVSGDTRIQVKEDELYLVKVGKRTIKIAM